MAYPVACFVMKFELEAPQTGTMGCAANNAGFEHPSDEEHHPIAGCLFHESWFVMIYIMVKTIWETHFTHVFDWVHLFLHFVASLPPHEKS